MQTPLAFHGLAAAQVSGDRLGVERGRHHDHLQLRPHRLTHAADHGQGQIAVQVALVELVEHDHADRLQERIVLEHAQQDALGDHLDSRGRSDAPIEPHLVAHLVSHASASLEGHAGCARPGRQSPRLQHHHRPLPGESGIQDGRRHPGGLARPGRRPQGYRPAFAQRTDHLGQHGVDRQRMAWHGRGQRSEAFKQRGMDFQSVCST
jgi:hypothetical protein